MPPRFLIFDSEPKAARAKKRAQGHAPSADSFAQTVLKISPDAVIEQIAPAETDGMPTGGISSFDAVFLSGSPLHFYEDTHQVRRIIEFKRAVFQSGTPSFGSCAGLQIATVAAGGRVGAKAARREAGIARLIYQTPQGLKHPLLSGRSPSFDAPAVHSDEVQELPAGAILLASSKETKSRRQKFGSVRHCSGAFNITLKFPFRKSPTRWSMSGRSSSTEVLFKQRPTSTDTSTASASWPAIPLGWTWHGSSD